MRTGQGENLDLEINFFDGCQIGCVVRYVIGHRIRLIFEFVLAWEMDYQIDIGDRVIRISTTMTASIDAQIAKFCGDLLNSTCCHVDDKVGGRTSSGTG